MDGASFSPDNRAGGDSLHVRVENCRNGAKPLWDEARELGEKEKSKENELTYCKLGELTGYCCYCCC